MLVALYARVSTQRQENEETIESQIAAIKEFIEKNKYTLVREYRDDGWSGSILARPKLDELRLDAKNKIWDAVVIYDPDRLARRYAYQELVTDELNELGLQVLYVTTPPPKDENDRLMYGVKGLFAEYERARIAERFRLGKLRKAREGHIVTTSGPYGYKYILRTEHSQGYLAIDEVESAVVRMIFEWVGNQGLTIRAVVKKLQELGIKPRKSKRGVWNTSTLTTMLRNETYIGKAHYLKSYAVIPDRPLKHEKYKQVIKTSRKNRARDEWIEIPTPRIIADELFFQTRDKLKSNFTLARRNRKNEYLLVGKIFCECGKRRAGEGPQRGKHLYYRCEDRVNTFPLKPNCSSGGLNARIADDLVWQYLCKFMTSRDLIKQQAERWAKNQRVTEHFEPGMIVKLEGELAKIKREEQRYVEAYGADLIPLNKLQELVGVIKSRRESIDSQITSMQDKMATEKCNLPDDSQIDQFVEKVREWLPNLSFDIRQALVRELVDKIVANQQEMTISGYLPIGEESTYVKLWSIGRHSRFTKCRQEHVV